VSFLHAEEKEDKQVWSNEYFIDFKEDSADRCRCIVVLEGRVDNSKRGMTINRNVCMYKMV
jgi:hypothetical protein